MICPDCGREMRVTASGGALCDHGWLDEQLAVRAAEREQLEVLLAARDAQGKGHR